MSFGSDFILASICLFFDKVTASIEILTISILFPIFSLAQSRMAKGKGKKQEVNPPAQSIRTRNGRNDALNDDCEGDSAIANVNKPLGFNSRKETSKATSLQELVKKGKQKVISKATFSEGDELVHMEIEGDEFPS